jgi:hypothetical protein
MITRMVSQAIMDKDLKKLSDDRWKKAFEDGQKVEVEICGYDSDGDVAKLLQNACSLQSVFVHRPFTMFKLNSGICFSFSLPLSHPQLCSALQYHQ